MNGVFLLLPIFTSLLSIVVGAPDLPARGPICGAKGYDSKTEGYYYSPEGIYSECSAACQQDSQNCLSFSYGNGTCNLYSIYVAGNLVKNDGSPYVFYDSSCIATSSSRSGSGVSTTSPTTTKVFGSSSTTRTTSTRNIFANTKSFTTQTVSASSTTRVTTFSTSGGTPTPPCALPTWTVSNFIYFNSSHNLDCAGTDFNNALCYTGRNPQPAGYGPPDSIAATVSPGIGSCKQQNPGTTPRREVGDDVVRCGGSAYQFAFFGNSSNALSTARFNVQNQINCPDGSSYFASGSVTFEMSCFHDDGQNATCRAVGGVVTVPATSFR